MGTSRKTRRRNRVIVWLALGFTVLVITVPLEILVLGLGIMFFINVIRSDPTVIMKWDKERFKEEQEKQPRLAAFIDALNPIAFWWINTPMFLHYRFVKKNKFSTWNDPRGLLGK
jgi:hypothetical protein